MEDGSDSQIEALGGGPLLRTQTTFAVQSRPKKVAGRIRECMGTLAVPLYILIGQNRQNIIYNSDFGGSLKLTSDLHDKCQDTLIQFAEFMHTYCASDVNVVQSIPNTYELVCKYHLEPQAAFLLTRPYINPNGHYGVVAADWGPRWSKEMPDSFKDSLECLDQMVPASVFEVLSPELYASFWCLGLYDLQVMLSSIARQSRAVTGARRAVQQRDQEA